MSKKNPLVSVCVINYNNAEYLPDCINSVLAQSYPNIEIVFCDDASTDNSREVFEKILEKSSRKLKINRQYRKTNGGLGGAANCYTAASNFNGDYVCFLDADDFLHPDHVQVLWMLINQHKTDISATNHEDIHNGVMPEIKRIPNKFNTRVMGTHETIDQFYFQQPAEMIPFSKCQRLYARGVFCDITDIPEDFFGNSDSAYSIYCFINAKNLVQADGINTYYYRILETSDSHASWYQLLKNRTYGSVEKLSAHYSTKVPKLKSLSEERNNQTVIMMFKALVEERLSYRECKYTWGLARKNNFIVIREQVFGRISDRSYIDRLVRKSFLYTPLWFYLWKKIRVK